MHGGMARQSFKSFAHIYQILHLFILFVHRPKFRIHLKRARDADWRVVFARYHLGNPVHIIIRKIQCTPDIAYHPFCRHRTKGHDLHHLIMPIFLTDVINDLLPALIAEININIGHGHTLGIQKTLKQQAVADRVNIRDMQAVRYNAPCCRAAPGSNWNIMLPRPVDKIPDNQEIIDIPHLLDDA